MSGRKLNKDDLLELARALGDDQVDDGLIEESMVTIFQRCLDRARELGAPASPWSETPHPKVREWCATLMTDNEKQRRELNETSADEKWVWYRVFSRVRDSSGRPCEHDFAAFSEKCLRCPMMIDEVRVDEACSHKFVDSKVCLHCGVSANVLKAKHRRELAQLEATGPRPVARAVVECEHAGELTIDRATGEESCTDCDDPPVGFVLVEDLSQLRPEAHADRVRALLDEPLSMPAAVDRRENAEKWAKTRGSKGATPNA